jgi:hypothetical protein
MNFEHMCNGALVPLAQSLFVQLDLPAGFRPAVTHKSDRGPVHSVQVRPASLAEWQKQVRIGILRQICPEFSEIEARLQRDLDDPSDHSVAEVDYAGGAKSLIRFNSPIRCCSSPFTLNPSVT